MVKLEELKKQFRVSNIAAYGRCIIIPMARFKDEWDQDLLDQGIECHAGNGFVYVKLGKEDSNDEAAKKIREQGHIVKTHGGWSASETKLLMDLWTNPKLKVKDIHKHFSKVFPKRTDTSIRNKLQRLRNAGKIKPRKKHTRKPRKTEQQKEPPFVETSRKEEMKLTLAGWIYELRVEGIFIEYFAAHDQAKKFAEAYYKNLAHFIKPVSFFGYDP